jgi:hypothetical protein
VRVASQGNAELQRALLEAVAQELDAAVRGTLVERPKET